MASGFGRGGGCTVVCLAHPVDLVCIAPSVEGRTFMTHGQHCGMMLLERRLLPK
jgi:hypothetical protein